MYTIKNFKTKNELRQAIKFGQKIKIFDPNLEYFNPNGTYWIEGPWYPEKTTWFSEVEIKNGFITNIKK